MASNDELNLTAAQIHGIEFVAGMDCQLKAYEGALEPALRQAGAWRDWRIASSAAERAIDKVYSAMDLPLLRHMQRLCDHGEVIIRPKPMVRSPQDDVQIVPNSSLRVLINHAIAGECAMCVRDRAECKRCELRKALRLIAPTNSSRADRCPYIDVAAQNELGEYI